jgi:hypothetical protein
MSMISAAMAAMTPEVNLPLVSTAIVGTPFHRFCTNRSDIGGKFALPSHYSWEDDLNVRKPSFFPTNGLQKYANRTYILCFEDGLGGRLAQPLGGFVYRIRKGDFYTNLPPKN